MSFKTETEKMQWQVKTILSKNVGGEDIEWDEMASLEGFNVSSDHLRRLAKGVKLVHDAGMLKEAEDIPEEEFEKIRKEKQKMWDLRKEVNESYRFEARDELLRESVIEAVKLMPKLEIKKVEIAKTKSERSLLVTISDPHYGKEVTIRGLRGEILNEYSPEIFEQRMFVLLAKIEDLVKETNPDELVIPCLGDSMEGMMRASQLITLRYGMIESCMRFSEFMANWLNILSESIKIPIRFVCIGGNHDTIRPLGSRKASDFPQESLAKIIGWFVTERLSDNKNIEVTYGSDIELIEVCGNNVLLVHGDNEKTSSDAAQDYTFLYGVPIDFVFRGHLHSLSIQTVGVNSTGSNINEIRSPSICGIDDFAMRLKRRANAGSIAVLMEEFQDMRFYCLDLG